MKLRLTLSAMAASLTLGAATAFSIGTTACAAEDDSVATTPSDLSVLLGPDGLESIAIESWLRLRTDESDFAGIEYTRITGEHGQLVIQMQKREGPHGIGRQRHVFTDEGLLIESRSEGGSIDFESVKTVVRDGDQMHLSHTLTLAGETPQIDEEIVTYQPTAGTIPTVWMPIAIAFHLREGNTRFLLRLSDDYSGRDRYVMTYHVVDAGIEEIEVCGEIRETHALTLRMGIEMDGQPMDLGAGAEGDSLQMHVLADGSPVRLRMEMRGFVVTGEAMTAEEAEELLAAGAGEEVGEAVEDAGDAIQEASE